jgi:hypothetical protein
LNIFFSDADPVIAAQNLDDKRVIKMILESAQMLCTALRENNAAHLAKYRATHKNHPSNIWARATRANYCWLLAHFKALCEEYTYRYGKVHASEALYQDLLNGAVHIPDGTLTPFANCAARSDININYKNMTDVVAAYRLYLIARWRNDKLPVRFTFRGAPSFLRATMRFYDTLKAVDA